MRKLGLLCLFIAGIAVHAAAVEASIIFQSDWSSAVGTSDAAVTDANKATPWDDAANTNNVLDVIADPTGSAPTANVLRVRLLQTQTKYGWVEKASLWPNAQVGETRYFRIYLYNNIADNAGNFSDPNSFHPYENAKLFVSGGGDDWNLILASLSNGTFPFKFAPGASAFPSSRWIPSSSQGVQAFLTKSSWWRIEWSWTKTGATTYTLDARIYDSNGNLLYDKNNIRDASLDATLAANQSITLLDPVDVARVGTNGGGVFNPLPSDQFIYWAAYCVRNDTWCGPYTSAAPVFQDNLDTGSYAPDTNGYGWNGAAYVNISTDRTYSGSYSLKFSFGPDLPQQAQDWHEQDFKLGAYLPEAWFQYMLYVPSNFYHRNNAPSSNNNKFFLLWGDNYATGYLSDITLISGGAGYSVNDVLTLVQNGASGGTLKVLTVNGSGAVLSFQITNHGLHYAIATNITASGGNGTGFIGNVTALGSDWRSAFEYEPYRTWNGSAFVYYGTSVLRPMSTTSTMNTITDTQTPQLNADPNFITSSGPVNIGAWNQIRVHVKAASAQDANDGVQEMWVNGNLVMQKTNGDFWQTPGLIPEATHTMKNGYLLGWSNSGFTNETDLYVDDFKIYDQDPGWGATQEQQTGVCEATGNATCYYIDPVNGNDNNTNGTFAAPWKSFSNLISWYQPSYRPATWKQLGAGDYIYLMNGTVNTMLNNGGWNNSCGCSQPDAGVLAVAYFRNVPIDVSGTQNNPIHLKNYPGENPAIGDTMDQPYNYGLALMSLNWWEVSGIEFKNISGDCIEEDSTDVKLWNLSVHDCARKDTDGNPAGIKLYTVRAEIFNSSFADTFFDPTMNGNPQHGTWFLRGAGIQAFQGANISIHNNYFKNTKYGENASGSPAGYPNCVFQKHAQQYTDGYFIAYNNTFINCLMAFGSGTQNTWFHHNVIINSSNPIKVADFGGITYEVNQLYEYNTIVDSKFANIEPSLTPYNNLFPILPYNITFRNNIIVDDAASYDAENNIFDIYAYISDIAYNATAPQVFLNNNCYYNPNTAPRFAFGEANGGSYGVEGGLYNLSAWQALTWNGSALNYDTNSIVADPLFVNKAAGDYHLQANSSCSSMGLYASEAPTKVGDVNHDGAVNFADLWLVMRHLARLAIYDTQYDLNGDGKTDVLDMVRVVRHLGS